MSRHRTAVGARGTRLADVRGTGRLRRHTVQCARAHTRWDACHCVCGGRQHGEATMGMRAGLLAYAVGARPAGPRDDVDGGRDDA